MYPQAPQALAFPFTLIVVVVATAVVQIIQRVRPQQRLAVRLGLGVWLLISAVVAAGGWLRTPMLPPPMFFLLIPAVVTGAVVGYRLVGPKLGTTIPVSAFVLLQAFRLPLELVMHHAYELGVMPVQMSFSGRNFDIVTGITALVLGLVAMRWSIPHWVFRAWNVLGAALLVNIAVVAIMSFPGPTRVFMNEPANVWVTYVPFVWLPTFLVPVAAFGHAAMLRYRPPAAA